MRCWTHHALVQPDRLRRLAAHRLALVLRVVLAGWRREAGWQARQRRLSLEVRSPALHLSRAMEFYGSVHNHSNTAYSHRWQRSNKPASAQLTAGSPLLARIAAGCSGRRSEWRAATGPVARAGAACCTGGWR